MKKGEILELNNGDTIKILEEFTFYGDKEQKFFRIVSKNGDESIISESELLRLQLKRRSTKEKLRLYRRYFNGRPDIVAQKWSNGKGYSPALTNWWDFYNLRNSKEAQSKLVKEYLPYTEKVIYDQIMSDDRYHRYGIYPLLKDDTTNLLVFDFDNHSSDNSPDDAAKAIIETCGKYKIKCLNERSSSGQGYHIWIFFSQPIKAELARGLGKLLLMEAISSSESLDFTSFDRMIPNQDHLPKRGFGNLISLPLKWSDIKNNCSTFVDDKLIPFPYHQIFDVLEATPQYSESQIRKFIQNIRQDRGILSNDFSFTAINENSDIPKEINGYIDGEINIQRTNLTHSQQLALLCLATFDNPEYIQKQRMRVPVWDIPSVLTLAKIDHQYIRLPRGLYGKLSSLSKCQFEEKFNDVPNLKVKFKGELRDSQIQAINRIANRNLGTICAHTGFGKTVVGCGIISKRQERTLIIVPTTSIAKQWKRSVKQFLKINDDPYEELTPKGRIVKKEKVEIISGSRNHPSNLIDIVSIQKLSRMTIDERKNFFIHYGQVIVDECHHIAANTFESILSVSSVKYIVGLTATPERKDGLENFVFYRCGEICYQSSDEELMPSIIQRYLYPRYSGVGELTYQRNSYSYAEKINNLSLNDERNQMIVQDVIACLKEGRHILLLSERVNHLKILQKLLLDKINKDRMYLVTSGNGDLRNVDLQKPGIILSTSKFVGEGFDLPELDTLFLTLPFSWKGNTKQYLGRLERGLDQKDELRVFDYIDLTEDMFEKMYRKRLKVYQDSGYQIVVSSGINGYRTNYFGYRDYYDVWENDLHTADHIFVRCKKLGPHLISELNNLTKLGKTVNVEISEKEYADSKQQLLTSNVESLSEVGNNICMFDHQISWYGDVNFGDRSYPNMSVIRINSKDVAKKFGD